MFKNFFGAPTKKVETIPEISTETKPIVETQQIPLNPIAGKSPQEQLEIIQKAKDEIRGLQIERISASLKAHNQMEEQKRIASLSPAQQQVFLDSVWKDERDISKSIEAIRAEFGFKPSAEEVLEYRRDMLLAEGDRLGENLAQKYRDLRHYVSNLFPSMDRIDRHSVESFRILMESLQSKYSDLPEIKEYLDTHKEFFEAKDVSNIDTILRDTIKNKTIYKTKGDEADAMKRRQHVLELAAMNDANLSRAQKHEDPYIIK